MFGKTKHSTEPSKVSLWLDRRFKLSMRETTPATEFRAGLATFMVMAYIILINPTILSNVSDGLGDRLAFSSVLTMTCLTSGTLCILMGLVANAPLAMAPGMGLNAVVAYQLVGQMKLSWPQAMTVIFLEGVIILILVLTRFREAVLHAIPLSQKRAIAAGIGTFIALIGFVNSGLVVHGQGTLLTLGKPTGLRLFVLLIGFFIMSWLLIRKVNGAIVIGILSASVLAVILNLTIGDGAAFGMSAKLPEKWFHAGQGLHGPDAIFGRLDFTLFQKVGFTSSMLAIFSLMLSDFFDTMGTIVGLGDRAGLLDEHGRHPRIRQILLVDSLGAIFGGLANCSSNTTYIESAAGISEGGRSGLTSIVVGLLFLCCTFLSSVASIVPAEAAAPGLILVGLLMMTVVGEIQWTQYDEAIPAFVTWLMMPLTYSITTGIGAGFIAYTLLKVLSGRVRDIRPLMGLSTLAFAAYFFAGV